MFASASWSVCFALPSDIAQMVRTTRRNPPLSPVPMASCPASPTPEGETTWSPEARPSAARPSKRRCLHPNRPLRMARCRRLPHCPRSAANPRPPCRHPRVLPALNFCRRSLGLLLLRPRMVFSHARPPDPKHPPTAAPRWRIAAPRLQPAPLEPAPHTVASGRPVSLDPAAAACAHPERWGRLLWWMAGAARPRGSPCMRVAASAPGFRCWRRQRQHLPRTRGRLPSPCTSTPNGAPRAPSRGSSTCGRCSHTALSRRPRPRIAAQGASRRLGVRRTRTSCQRRPQGSARTTLRWRPSARRPEPRCCM
mmetsp:Transcript_27486/g.79663  ORF Transcript_27486/g.79663 Transcript_27486/m.79663 type:complete len:309 (-) Transcript_27486:692-1618(-)